MLGASVIVPARDAARTLAHTLCGLAAQELDGGHEVIVVDNGSRDDTAATAAHSDVVSQVIRRPRGEGPGAARNAGAAVAGGSVLVFLDADCRPAPGWLAAGVAAMGSAELVQGKVLPDPRSPIGPFDRTLSVGHANGLFESANLFVARNLFERLGGFRTGLEVAGEGAPFGEDVVFGWRARRAGAKTAFCADALVYHEVSERRLAEHVAERARLAMFPALAAEVPELRDEFFYGRYFLSSRSASFDLAAGALVGAATARRGLPLLATLPYLLHVAQAARRWGKRRALMAAGGEVLADARGAIALAQGSLAAGEPVL